MLVLVSSRLPLRPNTRPYTIDCKANTLTITMATKRIIRELEAYNRDPSPVLSRLEPISDDNLLELTATLLGPEGTAYEGNSLFQKKKKQKKGKYYKKPLPLPLFLLTKQKKNQGGKWNLHINLPTTYPSHPPTIHFTTPICHPNIKFPTGEICLDLLSDNWTPAAYGIVKTLEAVQYMLDWEAGAEPTSPLNVDVARLMREGDWVGVEGLVRFYTWFYAGGRG